LRVKGRSANMPEKAFYYITVALCLLAMAGCSSPEEPITAFVVDTYNPTSPGSSLITWVMDLFAADGTPLASAGSFDYLDDEHQFYPYISWTDIQPGAEYFVRVRPENNPDSGTYAIRLLLTSPADIAKPRAASWYFPSPNPGDPVGSPYDWPPTSYQELASGLAGKLNCSIANNADEVDWFRFTLP
jgi:hypothetical protein